jgi:metal-responsive CopG/Arc/MetJ family transcriptional regulator
MARSKYVTVKIPLELARVLDESCANWGYRSRAEIVDDALRIFVMRMRELGTGEHVVSVKGV